jgi:hypothetical protein
MAINLLNKVVNQTRTTKLWIVNITTTRQAIEGQLFSHPTEEQNMQQMVLGLRFAPARLY